jgi:hypothetical protein
MAAAQAAQPKQVPASLKARIVFAFKIQFSFTPSDAALMDYGGLQKVLPFNQTNCDATWLSVSGFYVELDAESPIMRVNTGAWVILVQTGQPRAYKPPC